MFAAGKAGQKKALIIVGLSVIAVVVLALGWIWYFSTARLVDANAATFHRLRKEYCAVAKAAPNDTKLGTFEVPSQVRVPSLVSLYLDDGGNIGPGANAEMVELPELEWLCSGTPAYTGAIEKSALGKRVRGDEFQSNLSSIFDRERLPYLRYKGVEALLPFFSDLRYLVVIESKQLKEGSSGLTATVSLFRLEDSKRLSRLEIVLGGLEGGVAWVKRGENVQDALLDASRFQTERSHKRAIAAAFKRERIDFAFNGLD